jgi:hypothetical protein
MYVLVFFNFASVNALLEGPPTKFFEDLNSRVLGGSIEAKWFKKKKKDPVIGIRPATPTSISPFSFGVQVSQFLRFKAWFLELLAKGI